MILVCASPTWSWGQGNLGGLTGHVTDPSGAAAPEASVKVTNLDTGEERSIEATNDGAYLAPGLGPGRYRVTVAKTGFKTIVQEPVIVSTATVSTLDFVLTVGEVNQSIAVSGGAAQLETNSAEIGTVMPDKAILDLPISLGGAATTGASGRRQIQNFIYLTPGVTGDQWGTSINGSPGMSAEILIDGGDMQNIGAPGFIAEQAPPYEAVTEFKVQNALYPAEYGAGYGVMNFTMKSGSNAFHGDLYEFLRNDKLDARGFFGSEKNILRQNEFGGTIGGPVILPHFTTARIKRTFSSPGRAFGCAAVCPIRARNSSHLAGTERRFLRLSLPDLRSGHDSILTARGVLCGSRFLTILSLRLESARSPTRDCTDPPA